MFLFVIFVGGRAGQKRKNTWKKKPKPRKTSINLNTKKKNQNLKKTKPRKLSKPTETEGPPSLN